MDRMQHPSNNRVLGAPSGWDQDKVECTALSVTCQHSDGGPVMVSYWKPTVEELARLAAGKPVELWVFGMGHPPVALQVEA